LVKAQPSAFPLIAPPQPALSSTTTSLVISDRLRRNIVRKIATLLETRHLKEARVRFI